MGWNKRGIADRKKNSEPPGGENSRPFVSVLSVAKAATTSVDKSRASSCFEPSPKDLVLHANERERERGGGGGLRKKSFGIRM